MMLQDPTPVVDRGPPKSITVEDSFKSCGTFVAAQHVLQVLAPDLLARMAEDSQVPAQNNHLWACKAQEASLFDEVLI